MSAQEPYQEPFQRISVDEAKELVESGKATLVDVREPWEYERDHIAGAKLVPLARILSQPQQLLDEDNVVFHCEVGQRSAVAAEVAASLGRKNIYNMEGGMTAWRQKGFPVEKS